MKDWQKGHELAELQALAEPFRLAHKPHVYGAFGLVKEREIAEALATQSLLYTRGNGQVGQAPQAPVAGAAIIRRLRSASQHTDFAGRAIRIEAGAALVSAIAALTREAADRLVAAAIKRSTTGPLWVEVFEEDATAKGAVIDAGLTYRGTKVMAGSEIKGLYCLGRGTSIEDPAEDATLLDVEPAFVPDEQLRAIRAELAAFGDWAQHYSAYNKGKTWTAFALRGYDAADPTFIIKPREMAKRWQEENPERVGATVADTVASRHFPATCALVDRLPGGKDRVRFMRLAPGKGELTRHADITDREAGLRDGCVARLHIPIMTNPRVRFQAWTKRGEHLTHAFAEGSLGYLDQRKPHAVVNEGDTERVHLVVDCRSTPALRGLIGAAARAPA